MRAAAQRSRAALPRGGALTLPSRCQSCERENPNDAAFCAGCGGPLARGCAACGRANEPDARFCNGCGKPLAAAAAAPAEREERSPRSYTPKHLADKILQSRSALEGERKQVTVLFADVKGSMELAGRVDPEAWHTILDGFFSILADGVHRFEGVVNQYTGDGIMALFGAPIAHEDHAQRACYAVLALREEERVAEASGDPRLRAMARYLSLYPWYHTGPVDRARERANELVAYGRAHGDLPAPFGGEDVLALVMGLQALLEVQHGSVTRARAILDEAQRIARERGYVESEGWTAMFAGWLEWIDGDAERALPYCRRGLEFAERIGSPFSIVWGLGSLAQVLARAGSGEALEVAERSVALCRERGTSLEGEGQHLAALAEACIVTGDLERARRVAEEAVEVARRRGLRRCEIDAWLALARAERAAGDPDSLRRARGGVARAGGNLGIEAEHRVRQIRALLSAS